ncbi:MAG: hypothetical protein C0190_01105 [Thermodesulfobacterium geofontis]|uniref:Uncharacterized protein n=1 Tax=Thermodesulfobacterium geofontis TaxID=1295609 RepID=A0A2N7PQ18_9BACT|nr:MAG: hypothetical protein C0190_01105 [Thermodesulfobacterium geofontis]PMP97893.1 MAG: hypothetical protein C0169_01720 [Thermodesulfobacterium geofontis]HEM55961.1 hypothetical protein [Thermodesulfobium narugense]
MEIKWLNNIPPEPRDSLNFLKARYYLSSEEAFKLIYITLKLKALSDSPIYKFLERTLTGIKFDEIDKREYLLTLSIHTLRELIKDHLDLKLTKNLYLFLNKILPKEFIKDVSPKHSILASQDIIPEILTSEEKTKLPSFLKAKHVMLSFSLKGSCEELITLLHLFPNSYVLKIGNPYQIFTSFSISEAFIFLLKQKEEVLKDSAEKILETLKIFFPECFGEI